MILKKVLLKVKGKKSIAFLVSFLSLILFGALAGAIIGPPGIANRLPSDYSGLAAAFAAFTFPLCSAFVVFCLCYSGKLYIKRRISALMVHVLFFSIGYILNPGDINMTCCAPPFDKSDTYCNPRTGVKANMLEGWRLLEADYDYGDDRILIENGSATIELLSNTTSQKFSEKDLQKYLSEKEGIRIANEFLMTSNDHIWMNVESKGLKVDSSIAKPTLFIEEKYIKEKFYFTKRHFVYPYKNRICWVVITLRVPNRLTLIDYLPSYDKTCNTLEICNSPETVKK